MGHWLDDIEHLGTSPEHSPQDSARIQDKKFRIRQNYDQHHLAYDGFLERLGVLVNRVNQLPARHRMEFGKIDDKIKETHLDNHLRYFSSSRRTQQREFRGILRPFPRIHYKHSRLIYFYVSSQVGKIDIEIHDEYLEKRHYDGKIIAPDGSDSHHHSAHKKMPRFKKVYSYDIEKLDEELALSIIDWLVFKISVNELPVVAGGEERRTRNEF